MKKDTRKMWLKRMVCYRVAAVARMTRGGVLEDVVFQETSGYVVVSGRVSRWRE